MCDKIGCKNPGKYYPVFLIRVHDGHPPAKAMPQIRVCEKCKSESKVEDFLGDKGWKAIVEGMRSQGKADPVREYTELSWERIDNITVFDNADKKYQSGS